MKKTFEEAWAAKESEGFRYGPDALEQVRFGWELRSVEIDAQAELIATLARLLKDREWDSDYGCVSCRTLGAYTDWKHKPDCELTAALKQGGVECAMDAP